MFDVGGQDALFVASQHLQLVGQGVGQGGIERFGPGHVGQHAGKEVPIDGDGLGGAEQAEDADGAEDAPEGTQGRVSLAAGLVMVAPLAVYLHRLSAQLAVPVIVGPVAVAIYADRVKSVVVEGGQGAADGDALLIGSLGRVGRQHVNKVEATLHGFADLVEEVAVEGVERADDAEVGGQLDLGDAAFRGFYGQRGVGTTAERRQQAAEGRINRGAVEFVYDQPNAAIAGVPFAVVAADVALGGHARAAVGALVVVQEGAGDVAVAHGEGEGALAVVAFELRGDAVDHIAHAPVFGGGDDEGVVAVAGDLFADDGQAVEIGAEAADRLGGFAPEQGGQAARQFGFAGAGGTAEDDVVASPQGAVDAAHHGGVEQQILAQFVQACIQIWHGGQGATGGGQVEIERAGVFVQQCFEQFVVGAGGGVAAGQRI